MLKKEQSQSHFNEQYACNVSVNRDYGFQNTSIWEATITIFLRISKENKFRNIRCSDAIVLIKAGVTHCLYVQIIARMFKYRKQKAAFPMCIQQQQRQNLSYHKRKNNKLVNMLVRYINTK